MTQTPQKQTFETDEQYRERCAHYVEFEKWLKKFNGPELVAKRRGLVLTPFGWRKDNRS